MASEGGGVMRRILIILVLAALVASCDGEDPTPPTEPADSPPSPTEPAPALGCPSEQPEAVAIEQPYAAHVRACWATDHTSLWFKNISSMAVVRVWPRYSSVTLDVPLLDETSFEALVAEEMANKYETIGVELLPPGRHLVAEASSGIAAVWYRIEKSFSVATYAVKAVAKWAEDRLRSPRQRIANGAAECAKGLAEDLVVRPLDSWSQALGEGIVDAPSCWRFAREVYDEISVPTRSEQEAAITASDEIAKAARSVRATLWDDVIRLAGRSLQTVR